MPITSCTFCDIDATSFTIFLIINTSLIFQKRIINKRKLEEARLTYAFSDMVLSVLEVCEPIAAETLSPQEIFV